MSDELSAIEKLVEEVLIDLMVEKVMSARIQASLNERSASLPIDCL
jgi:hypothetical protein